MFDLGFQELIVIFLVALIVFGPKKLPELGRTLGKWITEIKRGIYSARLQMENEFHDIERPSPPGPGNADQLPDQGTPPASAEDPEKKES